MPRDVTKIEITRDGRGVFEIRHWVEDGHPHAPGVQWTDDPTDCAARVRELAADMVATEPGKR